MSKWVWITIAIVAIIVIFLVVKNNQTKKAQALALQQQIINSNPNIVGGNSTLADIINALSGLTGSVGDVISQTKK